MAQLVKNPHTNAEDTIVECSIPGSGQSLEEEMAIHSSILAWRIPWTEETRGHSSQGHKESETTE